LPALRRIRRAGKFTETQSSLSQSEEHQHATDPFAQWLARETIMSPANTIAQDRLHAAYAFACASSDRPIVTKQMFGRRLRVLRPEIQEAQRMIDGKRQWVYLGIALQPATDRQVL
jgi:phage/plasmid-associated DNA primase